MTERGVETVETRPIDGVALHSWRLDEPDEEVARLLALLSEEEISRADRLVRADVRRRFVVGRGRLRELLGRRVGVDPREVAFEYGPMGKPFLAGHSAATHFNLAHSHEMALCAVASRPVGVDVERFRPMPNAERLADRWFHPVECQRMATAPDPLVAFFRTWTAKEAALKLIGVGVGESLPRVLTNSDRENDWVTELPPNDLGIERCRVTSIEVGAGYVGTLADVGAAS